MNYWITAGIVQVFVVVTAKWMESRRMTAGERLRGPGRLSPWTGFSRHPLIRPEPANPLRKGGVLPFRAGYPVQRPAHREGGIPNRIIDAGRSSGRTTSKGADRGGGRILPIFPLKGPGSPGAFSPRFIKPVMSRPKLAYFLQ